MAGWRRLRQWGVRLQLLLRSLDVPAENWPRLQRVANAVGTPVVVTPVVVLTGLLWAAILAASIATTNDEVLRDVFRASLNISCFAFIGASATQIAHILMQSKASHNGAAAAAYVFFASLSLFVVMMSSAFLNGTLLYMSTRKYAEAMESIECWKENASNVNARASKLDAARSDLQHCLLSVMSDASRLDLALAEKRITKEQRADLGERIADRCKGRIELVEHHRRRLDEVTKQDCSKGKRQ